MKSTNYIKMLYSKIENGQISEPKRLKDILTNVLNAEKLSESELNEKNIFCYQSPDLEPVIQKTGSLVFDEINNVVTREIINKIFDIQTEKDKKVKQVQRYISSLLSFTDKYYIRKMERGLEIPQEIADERTFIHSESDRMKNEINNLSDAKSIITYNFRLTGLQYHERRD